LSQSSIGVAVIGAGMAGRAHASGYRSAPAVFTPDLPDVRLVAIADAHRPFADDTARRYGYQRAETSWQAIAEAADIDAVSVVVANDLHREIVEALLDAGKHVLCEKPLAPSVADGQAMADRASKSDRIAAVGFTFRRSPAINAIRQQVTDGVLGPVVDFHGHYWCDYGFDAAAPMSWRYRGGPGSGALADIGTHLVDVGEFLCGPVDSVRGTVLSTVVPDRPVALGTAVGHAAGVPVSDVTEPVENEDIAIFTATFAGGATGTFSVSRVAFGLANALGFEVFCRRGAAAFDLSRASEFTIADRTPGRVVNGYRPGQFEQAGITLTGLNVNGNPLNPDHEVGPKHKHDLRQAITLAGLLGVGRIVAMSGLPAAHPGGRAASWVVNPWDSQFLDTLDYQWRDVVIPFWTDIEARARDAGVKVCIEMHPHNAVFNPGTMERLATEINATHVGAEMDPSHLFWQGIDPVAAIEKLGDLVYHAAAKDTRINEQYCRVYGVLDDRFERVPAEENPVNIGGRNTLNRWPADASWQFVAVGRGHDQDFWVRFLTALNAVDPGMAVNIEHEDAELGQLEGLCQAAGNLIAAAAAAGIPVT
jgi:predicted dehydrogenase